jgi:hypothetical protein
MKRSKYLIVNQGAVEIIDEDSVDSPSDPSSAFSVLLLPPKSGSESLAETQENIVDNATALIENFQINFDALKQSCNTIFNTDFLIDAIK